VSEGGTQTIAIVGAGAKGTGIAEALTRAGRPVILFDVDKDAASTAVRRVLAAIRRDVETQKIPPLHLAKAQHTLRIAKSVHDLGDAHVVIEAVAENLDLKRRVLAGIEDHVSRGTMLATNTGWLSVNAIGAGLTTRERFAGFHFLTPASTPLVEIIPALTSSEAAIETLDALARGIGYTPIISADLPGFVVAHLNRGLMGEAARILEAEVASPHVIDTILRASLGLTHGPFELYDSLGLDVMARAARHISEGWGGEPRFRDVPFLATRVAAGFTGHDGHRGFYEKGPDARVPPLLAEPAEPWNGPVYVSPKIPDLAATVRGLLGKAALVAQPTARSLNIVTPLGTDTLGDIVEQGLDPARSIGIDALLPGEVVAIAATPMTLGEIRRGAAGLILAGGNQPAIVRDTPGLVSQRVAAMIIAVGYAMLDKGVASAADIDIAATQALGYAKGPFALSGRIGAARSVQILQSLYAISGDARWRVPTNLRHVALMEESRRP
jgi:3-hydroxybutyryl-CoA dehydrogenase